MRTVEEWKAAYKKRMLERGISEGSAQLEVEVLEFDGLHYDVEKDDPVASADEAIESWVDDGD